MQEAFSYSFLKIEFKDIYDDLIKIESNNRKGTCYGRNKEESFLGVRCK